MKKFTITILAFTILSQSALADVVLCDWSKGIHANTDGTFNYSLACHVKTGQLVAKSELDDKQVVDLNKLAVLKDTQIKEEQTKAKLWFDTANNLQSDLLKVRDLEFRNNMIFFGSGVLLTVLAIFLGSKVTR